MRRALTVIIDAGDKTCASSPGKFCPHVVTTRFGTKWVCDLFNRELLDENGSFEGWLMRLPECIRAEKGSDQ